MKLYLEKTARLIRPATSEDADKLRRIPNGDLLPCSVRKPRNAKLFRKFYALVNVVAENHPRFRSTEDVKLELKVRAGHYDEHITADGEVVYVPKSIAYDECEPADFEAFYEKCVSVAATELLAGMERPKLEQYLEKIGGFE